VQQAQVFLVRRRPVLGLQRVISHAEHARREQFLPIAVLGKSPRLPHQPVDDVPVVHALLVPAPQTRQPFDQLLGIPDLHVLGIQADLDRLADEPTRHRVAVPLHMDQAALIHTTTPPLARFQPPRRQGLQHGQLFRQSLTTIRVESVLQLTQKTVVLFSAGKIPAATQQQRLVHGLLESPVPLLDVAVLVAVGGLGLLADESVMTEQPLIPLGELLPLRQVVHRRTQPIRPVPPRHGPQLPQGVLQPFAQALETLREADRHRLPVRVGQHEVVDHVLERLPCNGYAQFVHVREIRRSQPPGFVHLAEEHFLGRPQRGPPTPHLPLQGPQLPLGEPTRVTTLQLAEDGLGLQTRLLFQHRANLRPDLGERIVPRRPVVRPSQLAGQLPQPPILTCRLVVHVRPRRRHGQRLACRQQPTQLPHLFVRDHRKPPSLRDLRIVYPLAADANPAVA
jgi:hypothetical protein